MADNGNQGNGSGGVKMLLIVLGIIGVCLLICCGGGYWAIQKFIGSSFTMDAGTIRTMTADISPIEIPEAYQPQMGMDLTAIGVPMKMVAYGHGQSDQPAVILMQAPDASGGQGMTREDFEEVMAEQGHGQNLQVSSRERRLFDYAGTEYTFEFASGTRGGAAMRQVSGVFPAQTGLAFVTVIDTEENWDDDAVMQMIESTGGRYLRTEEVESEEEPEPDQPEPVEEAANEAASPADAATPGDAN